MSEETILDGADTTEAVGSNSEAVEIADNAAEEQEAVEEQATGTEDTDDKGDEGEGDDDAAEVPEEYADFNLPEGMEVDTEMLGAFKEEAKELGLTQEQAQKLVDRYVKGADLAVEKQVEQWKSVQKEWVNAVKADDEIGGKDMDEKIAVANQAITQFGTKELVDALQMHGYGNHPEVVRFMYRVGKQLTQSEAKTASPASNETIVDRWYGNTSKETN